MHGGSLCPRTVIFPLLSRTLAITEMRTLSCPQVLHFSCFFSRYCLISYRVGDWHYRIFPDFLNSGFSKAYTTEGKAKVTACSWNDYSRLLQITPDYSRKLIFYSKEQLFYCYEELRLKTLRKERSNRRLSLLGSIGSTVFPNCSTKKFEERTVAFSFFYSAGSDRISGNDKEVGVSVFTNRKIKTTKKRNTPKWPWGTYWIGKAYIRFFLRRCVRSQRKILKIGPETILTNHT